MQIYTQVINDKEALIISANDHSLQVMQLEKLTDKFRPAYPDMVIIASCQNGVYVSDPKNDKEKPKVSILNMLPEYIRNSPFNGIRVYDHPNTIRKEIIFALKEYPESGNARYTVYEWLFANGFAEEVLDNYTIFVEFDDYKHCGYQI